MLPCLLLPAVVAAQALCHSFEIVAVGDSTFAADPVFWNLEHPVQAHPAGFALVIPRTGTDTNPVGVVGALVLTGQHQPEQGGPVAADDEHGTVFTATIVFLELHPGPHDLTGICLTVELRCVFQPPGNVAGSAIGCCCRAPCCPGTWVALDLGVLGAVIHLAFDLGGDARSILPSQRQRGPADAIPVDCHGVEFTLRVQLAVNASAGCGVGENHKTTGTLVAIRCTRVLPMESRERRTTVTKTKNFAKQTFTAPSQIRNFSIIAHIDHGKSTLADRMLQLTEVVDQRQMRDQFLDRMDIERERGITIKAQNVRLPWIPQSGKHAGEEIVLHMIDTPGHVDFTYEVSRALEACEGAILLVDAAQGIEAQTLANLYLAMENDLEIIPVLNKIDLPAADPDRFAEEIAMIIGCEPEDVLRVSGKTGAGVPELLDRLCEQIPPPVGDPDAPPRALIFDSVYDTYRGVVTYVRVVDGKLTPREKITMMSTGATHELLEIGIISPEPEPAAGLGVGEVGYLITGVKDVRQSKVGDTVTLARKGAEEPLAGYQEPNPMVFSGLYPIDGSDYPDLRDALEKLQLNDAALTFEPETSVALGFGFRCGFLGLLHMEITRDRLQRENGLDLISTAPNVVYRVISEDGTEHHVTNPSMWPAGKNREVYEPIVKTTIIVPSEFVGTTMELCQSKRGEMKGMDYLSETRVELRYIMPLGEIIFDFFDSLKSRTRGYASLDYEEAGEQLADLVKVDILLQGEAVDAFSAIVHRDHAQHYGNKMTVKLKELIPRQQFEVPVQAAIGSKIIARENIRAIRKDVLSKCYGGDISRKRKLLEKQKEGKKRMKSIGRVDVPQEAFVAALSTDSSSDKK